MKVYILWVANKWGNPFYIKNIFSSYEKALEAFHSCEHIFKKIEEREVI